jgi:hypothetical protein
MDGILWWIGWRGKVALFLGLIVGLPLALKAESVWGLVGGLLPLLGLWFWGTLHINKAWRSHFDGAADLAADSGAEKLNIGPSEGTRHLLSYSVGSALLVKPARQYFFTPLYVGEKFLGIYEGAKLDMVARNNFAGSGTKELYYRHINSVDYQPPHFTVRSSSGEILRYQASHADAESALNAVRRRLREAVA